MRQPHSLSRLLPVVAFALALGLAACEPEQVAPDDVPAVPATETAADHHGDPIQSEEATFHLVEVASGLSNPWGLEFLPDGRMIVTERGGTMSLVENGELTPIQGLPDIRAERQGGLLDVRLHPDYADNGWIYFTYAAPGDGGIGTELARARLQGNSLVDLEVLYSMEPKTSAGQHFGSRIAFPGDGTVLFTIGDRGDMDRAQDLMDPAGSTLRLNEDGSIPDDNPFVGRDDALPELYTVGNRNSQGMAIHPETGVIWQTEHGPRGGDELNMIEPGNNYGWPEVTFGLDYRTQEQIGQRHDETDAYVAPVEYWTPAIAPSGTMFYTGDSFPGWRGNLFIGSLSREHLIRVVLDGQRVTHQEDLLEDAIGRIRYVAQGPDGFIYLLNDQSDAGIFRLEPAR